MDLCSSHVWEPPLLPLLGDQKGKAIFFPRVTLLFSNIGNNFVLIFGREAETDILRARKGVRRKGTVGQLLSP